MRKLLAGVLAVVLIFGIVGCSGTGDYSPNAGTNEKNDATTTSGQEIVLSAENILEYLKIDFEVDNISVKTSSATGGDKGEGELTVNTTALKRGDFENVSVQLKFTSSRGWDNETVNLSIPFDGRVEEKVELLCYATLLFDDPDYEMEIVSVSGKFVKG